MYVIHCVDGRKSAELYKGLIEIEREKRLNGVIEFAFQGSASISRFLSTSSLPTTCFHTF
jgi:hypothetical protein